MGNVRADVQVAVDHYLELYAEAKQLEKKMDALRKVIEVYMKENDLEQMAHSNGGGWIQLVPQERPVMTSRYTTYDTAELANLLPPAVRKKCLVEVVDKDKLEALAKLGEVPEDVLQRKVTRSSVSWVVRFEK
ncbi:hypothetical protein [Alicyclobacillus herbarius]|uniref:DUF7376 domain-containing protein n=1 Tax=Alicyclobacillus herbarius TaxID=122960 RepID=UPI000429CD0A|nr:hypothetical protein [Alicyclobacillus herbarius]